MSEDDKVNDAADFDAAFKGEDPKPAELEQDTESKAKDQEIKEEIKEEIKDVKEEIQDKKTEPTEDPEEDVLNRRIRKMEGTYGRLNRDFSAMDKTLKEMKDLLERQKAEPEPEKEKPKTMTELSEEHEWPEATEERLAISEKQLQERIDSEISKIRESGYISQADAQKMVEKATQTVRQDIFDEMELDKAHPGWKNLVNTPAFGDWFNALSEEEQQKGDSSLAENKKLLDRYKAYTEARSSKLSKQEALRDNLPPTSSDKDIVASRKSEEDEFLQSFNAGR